MIESSNNFSSVDYYVDKIQIGILQKMFFWIVFIIINAFGYVNIKHNLKLIDHKYKFQKIEYVNNIEIMNNFKNYHESDYLKDYVKNLQNNSNKKFKPVNNELVLHEIIGALSVENKVVDKNFYVVNLQEDLVSINADIFLDVKNIHYNIKFSNTDDALSFIKLLENKLDIYNKIISLDVINNIDSAELKVGVQTINLLNNIDN